ncbi:hypothetical protein Gohar_024557, partial [Gossypium harknessii]|nr:hypothetical protein [Gossypium harknessii]
YLHSSPLASSWVCLRTDGSVRLDEGFVAIGGILDGLNLLLERRFDRVSTQPDSIEAVNIIQDVSSRNSNSTLIRRILQVLNMFKQWKIQHFPREENSIAGSLAKSVRTKSLRLRLFEDPPLLI